MNNFNVGVPNITSYNHLYNMGKIDEDSLQSLVCYELTNSFRENNNLTYQRRALIVREDTWNQLDTHIVALCQKLYVLKLARFSESSSLQDMQTGISSCQRSLNKLEPSKADYEEKLGRINDTIEKFQMVVDKRECNINNIDQKINKISEQIEQFKEISSSNNEGANV